MGSQEQTETIRLVMQQPALPSYRVPVFRELARRSGIDLEVCYAEAPGVPNAEPDGFDATFVRSPSIGGPRQLLVWHGPQISCATRARCDVLALTWNPRFASLVPGLVRARLTGVRTLLWGHGYSKHGAGWRTLPRETVARLATALLFYSHGAAAGFLESGVDPHRVHVAPNSLDQTPIQRARETWSNGSGRLDEFRRQRRLSEGPRVLFVSRLDPDNRLDLLIAATAQLQDAHPGLEMVIIGQGESEERRLRDLARSLGVAQRVRFEGAVYDEDALAPWFLTADVFCYPANVGLSLLHAFGYGLPVVTSDRLSAQNPEVEALRHDENGLLYPHGDAAALADALRCLFEDREKRERLGQAALHTVREQYNIPRMVDGIEAAVRYCAGISR